MQVSKEEIMHIAKLANLNLEPEEIDTYILHLQDILNFANIVNNAKVDDLDISIGVQDKSNVFRKDEIINFGDREILLQNAPEQENGMFRIPKVL